jgi:hypothetical protein
MMQDEGKTRRVIPLWPDCAEILGIGHHAAKAGQIPTPKLGKRTVVPCEQHRLMRANK